MTPQGNPSPMDIGGPVQDIAPETNAAPSANVAPLASGVPGASGTPPPAPSNAMVGLDVSLEERVMMCNGIVKKLMAYRPDLSEDSLRENTSKFEGRVFNSVNTRLEYTHKIATGMAVVERQVSQTNPDIVSQAIAAAAAVNSAVIAARPSAPAAAATASAVVNVAVNPAVGPVAAVAQVPANIPPHGVRVGAPAPASQPATSQAHEPLNPLAPERATQYQPHLGRARAQQGFARAQVLETLSQGTIQQHQVQHAPQSQHTSVQTYVPNIRAQDVRQQQMAQHLAQQQALSHSQAATIQAHASRPAHTARRPPPSPQVALQNNARSQLSQGNQQLPLGQSMQQGQLNYHGQIANPHLQGLQQQLLAQYSPQPTSVPDQQSQGIRHQQLAQSLQQLRNAPTRIHDPMPAQQPDFDELERRLEQQHVQEQNNLLEKQYVEMHNLRARRAATAARGNPSSGSAAVRGSTRGRRSNDLRRGSGQRTNQRSNAPANAALSQAENVQMVQGQQGTMAAQGPRQPMSRSRVPNSRGRARRGRASAAGRGGSRRTRKTATAMDVEPVRQALPGSRVTPVATGAAGRPVAAGNGSQGPVGQGVQAVRRSMSAAEAMFWDKLEAMKRTYAAALSQIAPATNIMASRQPAEKQETFRKHMRDCLQILSIDNSHPLPPHVNVGLLNSAERFMQSVIQAYRSYSKALRERNAAIAAGTAGKASGTAGPVGLVQQATPQQHQSAPPQAAVQGATQNPQMQIVRQLQERQMRQAGSAGMHAAAVVTSTAQRSVAAHASPASSSAVCAPIGIAQQAQNELTTNTPVGSKGGATVIHGKTPATVKESGKHQHGIMPSVKLQSHFNTNAVGMPKKSTSGPIVKHLPEQKAFPLAARQDAKAAGRNEHPSTATASRPVPRTTASLGTLKANHCDQGPATCGPEARTEGVTASGNVRGHSANDATGSLKNEASGENISCAHEQAVRSPVVRQDAAPGGASEDMPSSAVDSQPVIANSTDEQTRQPAASVEGGTDDRDAHPLVTHQEDAIDGLDDQPAAAAGSIAPEKGTGDYARVPNLKKRSREQITRDSQVNQVLEIVQLAAEQAEHLERYEDARIQDTLDAMREGGTRSLTDGTNGDQLLNGALDDFEREFGTKLGKALEKAANSTLRTKSTETGLRPVKRLKE